MGSKNQNVAIGLLVQEAEPGLIGQRRIDMSDTVIKYLERAIQVRAKYHEAMTYLNLVYRQKSYAYFDKPDEWQKCVDKAGEWRNKTLEIIGKPEGSSPPGGA